MRKLWETINGKLLKALSNPASGYEQYIDIPEFTFMGVQSQPDFGHVKIWFHGKKSTIELKSLKERIQDFKNFAIDDNELKIKYNINESNDWNLKKQRDILRKDNDFQKRLI